MVHQHPGQLAAMTADIRHQREFTPHRIKPVNNTFRHRFFKEIMPGITRRRTITLTLVRGFIHKLGGLINHAPSMAKPGQKTRPR
jgi:hypothetical protein